jgi:hypothetical protein
VPISVRYWQIGGVVQGHGITMQNLSRGAIRMRRLRERRCNGWTRVIAVESDAMDAVALREADFLRQGESALDALPMALRRLVASIR